VRPAWERSRSFIMSLCTPETLRTPEVATHPKSGTALGQRNPCPRRSLPGGQPLAANLPPTRTSPCFLTGFVHPQFAHFSEQSTDLVCAAHGVSQNSTTSIRSVHAATLRLSGQHPSLTRDQHTVAVSTCLDALKRELPTLGLCMQRNQAQGRLDRRIEAITRERIRRDDRG
jgi:hypothetical protein